MTNLTTTLRLAAAAAGLALVAAACGADDATTEDVAEVAADGAAAGSEGVVVANQGGDLEGHTPRGFAGSGTGLFVGDNLNPNFPDGEGLQLLLTFELPEDTPAQITAAELTSDDMEVRGDPFEALGPLEVEPVTYDTFGPPLFELEADGEAVACEQLGDTALTCDVTDAAAAGVAEGRDRLQFRLIFRTVADGDGVQDLALFYRTDTNTNEPGIFSLALS